MSFTLQRLFSRPSTRLGWWAVGLAIVFAVMSLVNVTVFMNLDESVPWRQTLLPFYGILMVLCGLAAGVVALIAIIRQGERSWLVWLAVFYGLQMLFLVVGEFLIPH